MTSKRRYTALTVIFVMQGKTAVFAAWQKLITCKSKQIIRKLIVISNKRPNVIWAEVNNHSEVLKGETATRRAGQFNRFKEIN